MHRVPTDQITARRLADWREDLARHHATPAVLIAFGHDENSGAWNICVPRDERFTPAYIAEILRAAADALDDPTITTVVDIDRALGGDRGVP